MAGYFFDVTEKQECSERAADRLLADVRAKLLQEVPDLDKVGADALMLNALLIRAGRHRYYWPTLEWLARTAYEHGHRPYESPVLGRVFADCERARYTPFDAYHHFVPEVDEDYADPHPDYIRPLRFLPDDLYKWEHELGTNNEDTHKLYRGEDIDGPSF